jgi:hypothetical protein
MSTSFRRFARSPSSMLLVTYEDGRTAYLWVDGPSKIDDLRLRAVALERQASGDLAEGAIRTVRRVR